MSKHNATTKIVDERELHNLAVFAQLMIDTGDLEPWAEMIKQLQAMQVIDDEEGLWLIKCYNAYDSFQSAWGVFSRWRSPYIWATSQDRDDAAQFDCTQERRGLRGGRVLKHLDSYVEHLAGQAQRDWILSGITQTDPETDFANLTQWLRSVWGVGRQTAFEWAEFCGKAGEIPVTAADAQLWESEGPRRALQKLYGNPNPTPQWLDDRANETKDFLARQGVFLAWEDFETVICDFNVMRDGRYYVGRHLAALREEIDLCPEGDRGILLEAFRSVIPDVWRDIAPGIDKSKMPIYRNTGKIISEP
jgi:hypothetical protein